MAMCIICSKCGYINSIDDDECEYCGNDIVDDKKMSVLPKYSSYKFYNKFGGANDGYTNTPPFESKKESEPAINDAVEGATRKTDEMASTVSVKAVGSGADGNLVKICPDCSTENDYDAAECSCGCSLRRITAVAKSAPSCAAEPAAEINLDDIFGNDFEEDQLFLLIGRNGENEVPVVFKDDIFVIGRDYQTCLNNCDYVSRAHCFLRRMESGDIYLGENRSRPSTNGTYIRVVGDVKERITPGKGYLIKVGSVFYLDNIPVILRKKSC